jgi:hypothetical protein
MSKAALSSMEWRSNRIPFARPGNGAPAEGAFEVVAPRSGTPHYPFRVNSTLRPDTRTSEAVASGRP